jgi:SAM-dependent methyltransferase
VNTPLASNTACSPVSGNKFCPRRQSVKSGSGSACMSLDLESAAGDERQPGAADFRNPERLMVYLVLILALLITGLLSVWLIWRQSSRRRSLPCPAWLSWMVDNPFAMRRTGSTLAQLELSPGLRVLDGGCGPGRLAIPIAKAIAPNGSVLAVDIQPGMLERARTKAERAGVANIAFLNAGLGKGALPHAYFDRAVLSTVLGEVPDRPQALKEIFNALKPGGFLLVNEVVGDPHYQSLPKVRSLAREAGFRPSTIYGSRLAFSIRLNKA